MNMNIKKASASVLVALTILSATGCGGNATKETTNVSLGMKALQESSYESAREHFYKAIEENEDLQLAYRGLGMTFMNEGDYEAARDNFILALQSGKNSVGSLEVDISMYLASAYSKLNEYEKAVETYSNVLELKKKNDELYFLRGVAYLKLQETDKAIADFDKTISLDSKNVTRYINVFTSLKQGGQEEKGREYINKALSFLGDNQGLQKGELYYYLGEYDSAIAELENLSESGDNVATLYMGKSYEALGDVNYAASLYEKYLKADEGNGEVYNQLGLCKLSMEDYKGALECFQKGIKLGGEQKLQELYFNEAVACEYNGDFATAKTKFNEYLKRYPNDEKAKREAEFLKSR